MSRFVPNIYELLPKKYKTKSIHYKNESEIRIHVPFRSAIVATSGSGKTQLVCYLLSIFNCFDRIILFAKDLYEPIYAFLRDQYANTEKKLKLNNGDIFVYSNDIKDFPDVANSPLIKKGSNTLIIIDDMINEKSKDIQSIQTAFSMGRHFNVSLFFISQSFFKIPIFIRENLTTIYLLKIDSTKGLKRIVSEYQLGCSPEQIVKMYKESTKHAGNFFLIDLYNGPELRFRFNFSPFKIKDEDDESDNSSDDE